MTVPRLIVLLLFFGVLGIAVAALRAAPGRRSHRVQQMQFEQLTRRQRIWANEMEIARLRSPQMVRDRTKLLSVPVVPPYEGKVIVSPDESSVAE